MAEQILKSFLDLIEGARDLVITQMPDILQQYLGVQALNVTVWAWVALGLGLILGGLGLLIMVIISLDKSKNDYIECVMVSIFLFIIALVSLGIATSKFIIKYQIEDYPKGYLMQQVLDKSIGGHR